MVIFMIAKLAFMLCYHDAHEFQWADVLQVLLHGLSLDFSTALYFLILPLLLAIASLWLPIRQWPFHIYYGLMSAAFSLAFVADTSLYAFWNFKLDASCLSYLETPTEAFASVTTGYLLLRIGLFLMLAIAIFLAYFFICRFPRHQKKWSIQELLFYALIIPLMVIGIRGGIGKSTTNIGQVYFSHNQFLNHAAINPVFSFLVSFEKTASYIPDYHFMSDEECERETADLFPTQSIDPDTLLSTRRPNVVIVLLESCGELFAPVMPQLQQLKQEGINFANCYGNSWRTDRGTLCTWSGYPSFPTTSVMKMPSKTRQLPSIAATLLDEGYSTTYLYGGDINFTNMRSYLMGTGFERLVWQNDYTLEEQTTSQWGVRDDITFNKLYDMITSQKSPFLIGFSTLSTHEPWDVPTKKLDDEIENAFAYLDDCIGQLIDRLKKTPQWNDLLIVLLPDHSIDHKGMHELLKDRNRIPMVWLGGAVKEPRQVGQICNQTDLPATLLGQMGIAHDDFRFSRDVLSRNYRHPFAIHTFNNAISMVDSTGFAVYDLDSHKTIVAESPEAEKMVRRGMAILQLATDDIKSK